MGKVVWLLVSLSGFHDLVLRLRMARDLGLVLGLNLSVMDWEPWALWLAKRKWVVDLLVLKWAMTASPDVTVKGRVFGRGLRG